MPAEIAQCGAYALQPLGRPRACARLSEPATRGVEVGERCI